MKVDTDKRPDINKRYNQGGWPSTVFLMPGGQIISGATYLSPEYFKELMLKVKEAFTKVSNDKIEIKDRKLSYTNKNLSGKIVDNVLNFLMSEFDFEYGGFGASQKFPMSDAIELFIHKFKNTGSNDFKIPIKITLDNMKGIFDDVEGGFFRYSVNEFWSNPHYEKMLETNAGVIINYLDGYEIFKEESYKEIAVKCLEYVKKNLLNDNGGFYGSQDADENYYQLKIEERENIKRPFIDRNIYTDLNCMMIKTFFYAHKILKDYFYCELGKKSVIFLLNNCYSENYGVYHLFDGKNKFLAGMLSDNAYFISALLDCFEATNDSFFLEYAKKLNDFVLSNFFDKDDNAFFDKIVFPDDIGLLQLRDKNINENSVIAENFFRFWKLIKDEKYKKMAGEILVAFSEEYKQYGFYAGKYAIVIDKFLDLI